MDIYADELFFINLIFNYMALFILGKIMKLKIRRRRILLGAGVGALGAVTVFFLEKNIVILRLITAFFMILCAFGGKIKQLLIRLAVFWILTTAVSGAVSAVFAFTPVKGAIKNGIMYFNISGKMFFVILLAVYPLVCLIFKILGDRRKKQIYTAKIQKSDKSVMVSALYDSGNRLKDPITGRAVMIAEWDAVKNLFDKPCEFDEILDNAENLKLHLVPYRSLGKKNGSIFAFSADRISVEDKNTEKIFVGITNQKLSRDYNALLNCEFI